MRHKIFVGLSGGVDSAVSAALLQSQGYDVVGAFIKIWQPEFLECTWAADRLDAMRVCATLGIPFREIDLSNEYKKEVVERMVNDYARGVTPNPDVLCNSRIKFGSFATWAKAEGAHGIATGHYARKREVGGHVELTRARDISKDQSYFLYRLGQLDLARTMFPVGGMLKSEVRALAQKFNLPVAKKHDSQGLCFVGEVSMAEFLKRFIAVFPGAVLCEGKVVGEHEGAALYTIGQRHGFALQQGHAEERPERVQRVEGSTPYYVTGTDVAQNRVYVSARREDAERPSAILSEVHWVYREPKMPYKVQVQARYHEQGVGATLTKDEGGFVATFEHPHIASPGQSLVFYEPAGKPEEADVCLGGGILQNV
ncbi:tRNA 2-thiouridine(34) synthase MnmA [Candidatus Kaiserbacteria bacterium]|nr:tRNA 2-thiouridine(34) synthase MnmA [Candidatus Kaiserbacteria bacterium]